MRAIALGVAFVTVTGRALAQQPVTGSCPPRSSDWWRACLTAPRSGRLCSTARDATSSMRNSPGPVLVGGPKHSGLRR